MIFSLNKKQEKQQNLAEARFWICISVQLI